MTKTYFGFESVDLKDKQSKVNQVFDSVVNRYDLMNDLMSVGLHRVWKYQAIAALGLKSKEKVLDLATGSGDLSILAERIVGRKGMVVSTDINLNMLQYGRKKILNKGSNCYYVQMDAEKISFKDEVFDAVMVGFGLRNFPNIEQSLAEIYRVLKPEGRLMILEFSKVKSQLLNSIYQKYSFKVLPVLGKYISQNEKAYRYLAESIVKHPSQNQLIDKLNCAGFSQTSYKNLMAGVVAIHQATKL